MVEVSGAKSIIIEDGRREQIMANRFIIPLDYFRSGQYSYGWRSEHRNEVRSIMDRILVLPIQADKKEELPEDKKWLYETDPKGHLNYSLEKFAYLFPNITEVHMTDSIGQEKIVKIRHSVDALETIRKSLTGIPVDKLDNLFQEVETDISTRAGPKKGNIFSILLNPNFPGINPDSKDRPVINFDQLPEQLMNEGLFSLISAMVKKPELYSMQLGIYLSQFDFEKFPQKLTALIKPLKSKFNFGIKYFNTPDYLCPDAEPYLEQSITHNQLLAIGRKRPLLLAKFVGKLAALCLQNFITTENKIFIRGIWYSPSDQITSDALRKFFTQGMGRINIQVGDWDLIRPINPYGVMSPEDQIDIAAQTASQIPIKYPPGEIIESRKFRFTPLKHNNRTRI